MGERARVLLYDLETAPAQGFMFGPKWQTNVMSYVRPWYILSIAWKWHGEKRTHVLGLDDFATGRKDDFTDDKRLVKEIAALFDEAAVCVTHNGVAFDGPKAATRMLVHGVRPPSPYVDVDTCKIARRVFHFDSNRLADLAEFLGIENKADAGGTKTWLGCMEGDPKAWARMKRYNRQDVVVLEQLYERMLPWIPRHPNIAAFEDRPNACPKCGAEKGMVSRGWRWNSRTKTRLFQCRACGGWSTHRTLVRTDNQFVAL